MKTNQFDPITLEVLWNRLISITNEQAAALMRASFTTVVREAGDLSAGVFDAAGNMIAQAVTGTPGHINCMATSVRHFLREYPLAGLQPGDTLVTNDPWLASGHHHDFTIVTPVFHRGKAIGLFANTCHVMDIGGRVFGADAPSIYEEGLAIPIMKLVDRGRLNEDLIRIIRANVRVPQTVLGDVYAMISANEVGGKKLLEMMEDHSLSDLEGLSAAIIERSEQSMREAIQAIPDGTYRHQIDMDGFDEPIVVKLAITIAGDRDFAPVGPGNQRGLQLLPRLHHLPHQVLGEPGSSEQRGELPAHNRHRAGGLHPELSSSRPGGSAPHPGPFPFRGGLRGAQPRDPRPGRCRRLPGPLEHSVRRHR
jgi:N-methylhydantoinase B